MKNLLTILIVSVSTIAIAQKDSVIGNQYFLKGKIINRLELTPHCGTIAWGTVIEFEIIKFSDSAYVQKKIGVIFTCPELYKDNFFEVGKTYEIKIADKNQATFSWMIPNEERLEKYHLKSKLWTIHAKKVK